MSKLINAILEESEVLFKKYPKFNNKKQVNFLSDPRWGDSGGPGWGEQWNDKTMHEDHWEDDA